jgi:hypothetical protein
VQGHEVVGEAGNSQTMSETFKAVSSNIDERDAVILDWYFGVSLGGRMAMSDIGKSLPRANPDWGTLSRQRVEQIIKRIRESAGEAAWKAIEAYYPEAPSESHIRKQAVKARSAVVGYLRVVGPSDPLQYDQVHKLLSIQKPNNRGRETASFDDIASCIAFMQDYGARVFGRYRYCTKCDQIKPIDCFYKLAARGGKTWQICSSCNTKRAMAYVASNREAVNARRREWVKSATADKHGSVE